MLNYPSHCLLKKRERDEKIKAIRKENAKVPEEQKDKRINIQVRNKTLYLNNIPQRQHVHPPTVQNIFETDLQMIDKMNNIELVHTTEVVEKGSRFCGHAARVNSTADVKAVYRKMRLLFPESDHIVMSYKVKSYTGHADNGEYGAGRRVQKILLDSENANTVLFVSRVFGGIQLGLRRFLHIEKVARQALDMLQ